MTTRSPDEGHSVSIRRGSILLSRELYDALLPGITAVALISRDADVLIVPLAPSSPGGLLLKHRNAHGDRVLHAEEFFRAHGFPEDFAERQFPVRWHDSLHALALPGALHL